MKIFHQQDLLPGVDVDETNTGKKLEQVWRIGILDNLSPMEIYSVFLSLSFQDNNGGPTKLITINRY